VKLWLDAQISPAMAPWMAVTLGLECAAVRDLGFRDSTGFQSGGRSGGNHRQQGCGLR
jgi:predicted nuclease of predicted toxin-antitoxin system